VRFRNELRLLQEVAQRWSANCGDETNGIALSAAAKERIKATLRAAHR